MSFWVPVRLSKLAKAAQKLGIALEKPGHGSHWKFRAGSRKYTVPAHNGMRTEIDDRYVKAMARYFGVEDELDV